MCKRQCLCKVFVNGQRSGQRPGDLRNFEAMRQTCAVIVALVIHKDLVLCFNRRNAPEWMIGPGRAEKPCVSDFRLQETPDRASAPDDTHRARGWMQAVIRRRGSFNQVKPSNPAPAIGNADLDLVTTMDNIDGTYTSTKITSVLKRKSCYARRPY